MSGPVSAYDLRRSTGTCEPSPILAPLWACALVWWLPLPHVTNLLHIERIETQLQEHVGPGPQPRHILVYSFCTPSIRNEFVIKIISKRTSFLPPILHAPLCIPEADIVFHNFQWHCSSRPKGPRCLPRPFWQQVTNCVLGVTSCNTTYLYMIQM
mgnify:CR=1 FL=1